jgi:putative Flp pilus-assembly TadE/G-like protein
MPLSFWRSERGQTTAMIIVMLWVFILIVGMVANVGQAVNRRIALQTVADAGAFTGATVMAEGLNYMAYANWWIQNLWAFMTWAFWAVFIASGFDCDAPNSVISAYKGLRLLFAGGYEAINWTYAPYAYAEARRISAYNAADLFPPESNRLSYREFDPSPEAGFIMCLDDLQNLGLCRDLLSLMKSEDVPDGTEPEDTWVPALFDSVKQRTFVCKRQLGPIPIPSSTVFQFDVWYQRSSTKTRYFVWRVKAPATKAFVFDSFFGPNAIPEMTAVGVAKPVGGSIKKGQDRYVAKMVPVKNVMQTGGFIRDPNFSDFLLGMRNVTH